VSDFAGNEYRRFVPEGSESQPLLRILRVERRSPTCAGGIGNMLERLTKGLLVSLRTMLFVLALPFLLERTQPDDN